MDRETHDIPKNPIILGATMRANLLEQKGTKRHKLAVFLLALFSPLGRWNLMMA